MMKKVKGSQRERLNSCMHGMECDVQEMSADNTELDYEDCKQLRARSRVSCCASC